MRARGRFVTSLFIYVYVSATGVRPEINPTILIRGYFRPALSILVERVAAAAAVV